MALMTLDVGNERQDARVYFGGWQKVSARMGMLPSDDTRKRFIRDIATLRKLGIVEVLEPGRRGHTAYYRLILPVDNLGVFVDNSRDFVDNLENPVEPDSG